MGKRKYNIRINSQKHQEEAPEQLEPRLSMEQRLYCNGVSCPTLNEIRLRHTYVCPRCGKLHCEALRSLFGYFLCKCGHKYEFPREQQVVWTKPDVMSVANRIPIENPDWVK